MTEDEWLADDPKRLHRMFLYVRSPHDRKQRLALVAVLRVLTTRLPGPKVDRLLTAHEDWADHRDRDRLFADLRGLNPCGDDLDGGDAVFRMAVQSGVRGLGSGRDCRVSEVRLAPDHTAHTALLAYDGPDHRPAAFAAVRDVFGNPFRPVAFDPAWRTSTAVALARGMYVSRDFGAMPIMADALQDAGCDSDDVLDHCRGDGPHVRGCWVVDLVLGKE